MTYQPETHINSSHLPQTTVINGLPQGSDIGPVLFNMLKSKLEKAITQLATSSPCQRTHRTYHQLTSLSHMPSSLIYDIRTFQA